MSALHLGRNHLPVAVNSDWRSYYLQQFRRVQVDLSCFFDELCRDPSDAKPNPDVLEAIRYSAIEGGGKRVRGVLVHLVHDLFGAASPRVNLAALVPELPHRGSLIEDDLDDHAIVRDGRPAVHLRFASGAQVAREAAALLYAAPSILIPRLGLPPNRARLLEREIARLYGEARQGQALDLAWSRSDSLPEPEAYLEMCRLKCAAFEGAIIVGASLTNADETQRAALIRAGRLSAAAFQLRDDLLGLRRDHEEFGADIAQSKKTLPVILAADHHPAFRAELLGILALGEKTERDIARACDLMECADALQATQAIAERLICDAIGVIESCIAPSHMRDILRQILAHGVSRNH